jgi:hypothetical protein
MAGSRIFCEQAATLGRSQETFFRKVADKFAGCNRERYSFLLGKTIFNCSYDGDYLGFFVKSKKPEEIAMYERHGRQCDEWQKEFESVDKVCSRIKK